MFAIVYIALVCPYDLQRPGGVRSHIVGLGRALLDRGHRVEIVSPGSFGTFQDIPLFSCGRARSLSFGGTRIDLTWAGWSELQAAARRGYDVVHFHTIWNPAMPFQLASAFAGPKVATFHDVASTHTPELARWAMRPASALISALWLRGVIAVSPAVSDYLSMVPHTVIPNGISEPDLPPAGERRGVVYVGRLEPRKDVATLIAALAELRDLDLPVVIAGDGELRSALEAQARNLGLSNVTFAGEVSDAEKWKLVSRAEVLVAPSNGGESFGIVLLEAMAAGAVPLASDIPGYRGVLAERARESLFAAGNPQALATRLRMLLADRPRFTSLRAWGSEHWKQFRWSELAARVQRVYEVAAGSN